jgi:DNA polymerase-3 subunit delta
LILKRKPEIHRFLDSPNGSIRAAMIHGRDIGAIREFADTLARAVTANPDDPFDAALLSDADLEGDAARLEGELLAVSMMGGRRLVRLRLSGQRVGADRLALEALEAHLAGRLNPDAFFLVEAAAAGKDSPLRKLAERSDACAVIACYEDDPEDLVLLVQHSLASEGLTVTTEAIEIFVGRLPPDRGVARSEIERLILFLGPGSGRSARAEELKDFFGVEPDASLSQAAHDAFSGRPAEAHAALTRSAQEGEAGVRAVRALGLHLLRLRKVAMLMSNGMSAQSAIKAAGVFWKGERDFLRQTRAWTMGHLDQVQAGILAADEACKKAAAPDVLLAEHLTLSIAARARRLRL